MVASIATPRQDSGKANETVEHAQSSTQPPVPPQNSSGVWSSQQTKTCQPQQQSPSQQNKKPMNAERLNRVWAGHENAGTTFCYES